jgi:ribosome modulation factor
MTVFILPTSGSIKYRGKYPNRARHLSGYTSGPTGRHIELNDGTRLWSATDRTPEFSAGSLNDDYTAIRAKAVPMTDAQYATLKEAAEIARSVVGVAGHGRRARIDAQAREIACSITAPAPAIAEPEAPAVRRDNVEFHAGSKAFADGVPSDACPYLAGGERAARWLAGWNEAPRAPRLPVPAGSLAAAFLNPAPVPFLSPAHIEATRDRMTAEDNAAKAEPVTIKLRGFPKAVADIPAVETIDMTPTWAAIVPVLLAAMEHGTDKGRDAARIELTRMAALADERNQFATRLAALEATAPPRLMMSGDLMRYDDPAALWAIAAGTAYRVARDS